MTFNTQHIAYSIDHTAYNLYSILQKRCYVGMLFQHAFGMAVVILQSSVKGDGWNSYLATDAKEWLTFFLIYIVFQVYAGDEFDEYVPPFSFKLNAAGDGVVEDGTPLHAILFLVYKQPGR